MISVTATQFYLTRRTGDSHWLGTVALFAPRWPLLIPLAILAAINLFYHRKLLIVHAACALVLLIPIMGWCLPRPLRAVGQGEVLRVMTVNVGSGGEVALLREAIAESEPQVVALQECGAELAAALFDERWQVRREGRLCLASRYPITDFETFASTIHNQWGAGRHALRVTVATAAGEVHVVCLHHETPRRGLEELAIGWSGIEGTAAVNQTNDIRLGQAAQTSQWTAGLEGPVIVAGDFNMPVESQIYREHWSDYQNAFSTAGWGLGHTKYTRWHGVRIDHILANDHFRVKRCVVSGATGGDHRAVVAEFVESL